MSNVKLVQIPGYVPTTQQLSLGDILINSQDGKLYIQQYQTNLHNQQIIEVGLSSSYAATASYFSGSVPNSVSSSYATSASIAVSASYASTASYLSGSVTSASYSLSSSYAVSASYVLSASYVVSSSYAVTSSYSFYAEQEYN